MLQKSLRNSLVIKMRLLDHDNLNRFVGLSVDGPETLSIWRYCSRGSLRDVINNRTLNTDAFFIYSLIRFYN